MQKINWHRIQSGTMGFNKPMPRWGHNCCVIGQQIVFFGGYADSNYMSDMWTFNTHTLTWKDIRTIGDAPSNRSNCTMNYDPITNNIVIFGGGGPNKQRFNSVSLLDWNSKYWTQISPKQNQSAPWERTYHSAEMKYPYLIVYGGQGVGDMQDLWVFNFLTLRWVQVPIKKDSCRPCARRFHSSVIINNQFFVIAGCHSKYRCLSDVYSIDLTTLFTTGSVQNLSWKQRKIKGSFLTRWGHTSTVYENKIYIFGGRFSNDLNDILVIDINKNTMKSLKVGPEIPTARRRHCACFQGSCLIIFGGFNGDYFNDLHYINVFDSKIEQINRQKFQYKQVKLINSKFFHDFIIQTSDKDEVYGHKGLINKCFRNQQDMNSFIQEINLQYTKEQLLDIMECLYRGWGSLNLSKSHHSIFQIIMYKNQQQKYNEDRFKLQPINQSQTLIKRSNNSSIVILTDKEFSDYLEIRRTGNYTDGNIEFNKDFRIQINTMELYNSCEYFKNLIQYNQKEIFINHSQNNLILFQIMLSYLSLEYLVVPESLTYQNWMELCEIAEYYCLDRLKKLCQQHLASEITTQNMRCMMNFSLFLGLSQLSLACGEFELKNMANNYTTDQIQIKLSQIILPQIRNILQNIYKTIKFDLRQLEIQKNRSILFQDKSKVNSSNVEEKQNYQLNYIS